MTRGGPGHTRGTRERRSYASRNGVLLRLIPLRGNIQSYVGPLMKRRLLIVVIFLLTGAVVNLAVAWGCATRSPVEGTPSIPTVPEPGYVVVDRVWHGFGVTITVEYSLAVMYHVELNVASGWPLSTVIEDSWQHYQVALDARTADFMRSTDSVAGETLSDEEMARFGTSGEYELPSDEYATRFISEWHRVLRDATNQVYAAPRGTSFRRLLGPGFAINTLFYALVLWLLICGPFALRRLIRIRRGLCPECAYPTGESGVCSECGGDLMRRRLLVAAICLIAGAVMSVAVAWGCAFLLEVWTSGDKETASVSKDGQTWQVMTFSGPGALSVFSIRSGMRFPGAKGSGEKDPSALIPSWTPFLNPAPPFASGVQGYEYRRAEGRGWPMLGLWYETSRGGGSTVTGGGIPVGEWPPGSLRPTPILKVLPLRPVWPGFAVNTVFYAVVLWLLIPGPFVLRRLIRMKRSQCLKCGYPLGESDVCSECGTVLARRVEALS